MMTSEQVEELMKENERLRRRAVDKNPLCKGCEEWRRAMATLWASVWFGMWMISVEQVHLKHKLSDQEFAKRLFAMVTNPRFLLDVFGIAFAPLLLVIARWNWLVWKHDQPCVAKRVSAAYRWVAGHLRNLFAQAYRPER